MRKKRFHGLAGQEYDLFRLVCPHLDEFQAKVGETLKKRAIKEVLEIGCGTGITTRVILNAKKTVKVIAIDNEKNMIQQARKNISRKRVRFVLQDALAFLKKLPDDSIEVVASAFTIHNFHRNYRLQVFKEIHRVLKKGGLFVNGDKYVHDDPKRFKKELRWQFNKFREVYDSLGRPDLRKEWIKHYAEDARPQLIMKEGVFKKQMKDIGFWKIKRVYRKRTEAVYVAEKRP